MRQLWKAGARCAVVSGLLGLAVLLTGCQSDHVFAEVPGAATAGGAGTVGEPTGTTGGTAPAPHTDKGEVLRVGDKVKITRVAPGIEREFSAHEETIKEDGLITPPEVGPVVAAGRNVGDIQQELQEKYSRLYKNMTVTLTAGDRYYFVDGEVNQRGPRTILGETDLLNAIAAAGGFTDYAKKSKVRIIRKNGQTDVVDYNKAIEDPGYNARIYPGDKVFVPRRIW